MTRPVSIHRSSFFLQRSFRSPIIQNNGFLDQANEGFLCCESKKVVTIFLFHFHNWACCYLILLFTSIYFRISLRYGNPEDRNKEQPGTYKDRKASFQKSQNFNRVAEKKKGWMGWFKRSFRQSGLDDSNPVEYAAAVAAAAVAVDSFGRSNAMDTMKPMDGSKATLGKGKSKQEGIGATLDPQCKGKSKQEGIGEASSRSSEGVGRMMPINKGILKNGTAIDAPLVRRALSTAGKVPEKDVGHSRTRKEEEIGHCNSTNLVKTKADAWEKSQLSDIEQRYEKLVANIVSWGDRKREKALHRNSKIEGELERKRAKARQHYANSVKIVGEVVENGKEKAKRQRSKEEAAVKHRADKIRSTGRDP